MAATSEDRIGLVSVWRWILHACDWNGRMFLALGAVCAALFAAGTASLSLLVSVDKQSKALAGIGMSRTTIVLILVGLFVARPIFLINHIRAVSAALARMTDASRPVAIGLLHRVLVVTTRDIPLLMMLCASLIYHSGPIGLVALLIVPLGLLLATLRIRAHVSRQDHPTSTDERYLRNRNAQSVSEAISDLPQTLIMGVMIIWFAFRAPSSSIAPIAGTIVSVMLASPPLRRLTKLSADIATHIKNDDEE